MKTITENIRPILAVLINVMAIAYFFTVTLMEKKPDPQIIIAIVAAWSMANSFYFGSSTGTTKKEDNNIKN